MALAASGLVVGAAGLQASSRDAGLVPRLAVDTATVRVVATVASDPRRIARHDAAGGGRDLVLVRLRLHRVEGRGSASASRSRVLVFADPSWSALRLGQQVQVTGRLGPARPGDDVSATLAPRGPPRVLHAQRPLDRTLQSLRDGLARACAGLPPDARGLLPGLVVGDTSAQPPDLAAAMQATGLTHLSAVSGSNTTLVCVLAVGLGARLGLGRRTRLVVAAAVLGAFVLLARAEPSVLRAAVMGAVGLLAVGSGRRRAAAPALGAAVVVLLVVDPWLSRSAGFALSVLATLGLLLVAPGLTAVLARRLPGPLATAVALPLAAQVLCGPVVVLLSGAVSLVSLPANLVAAPIVAPVTVLGLAATVLGPVWDGGAAGLARVGGLGCTVVAWTARTLAGVPGGQVRWPGGAAGALVLAALSLAALLAGPTVLRWAARRPAAARLVVCAAVGAAVAVRAPVPGGSSWPPRGWVLVACDVGQGDALVLSTGPGRAVLVDAGPTPGDVDRCLRRLQVRQLDLVLLTHFHADHVDGLPGVLRGRRVGGLGVTVVDDPPQQARRVRALAAAAGVAVRVVRAGEQAGDGPLRWQVLWPQRVVRSGSVPNNASIVLLVQVAGLRLLLLGDVEPEAARAVATSMRAVTGGPAVDVLKVAHHGSAKQDPALIRQSHPRLALVSVGAGNDYGHPAPSAMRLLGGVGARVARTDVLGDLAVVVRSGVPSLVASGPRRHDAPPTRGGAGASGLSAGAGSVVP
ncbi:ComEC/Rec2 family competence protein [Angustibacter aerolatus]